MKSKKVTMIAAALVVAVVALAGIGYATTYKATTTNTDNSIASTYITLSQDGYGSYAGNFFDKVYFDTMTVKASGDSEATTTYTPVYTHVKNTGANDTYTPVTGTTVGDYALISLPLTITIAKTNSTQTLATMKVTVTHFAKLSGLDYTMILGSIDDTTKVITATKTAVYGGESGNTTDWTFENVSISDNSTSYKVFLFISADSALSAETNLNTVGFNVSTTSDDTDSVFTFVVTADSTQGTQSGSGS